MQLVVTARVTFTTSTSFCNTSSFQVTLDMGDFGLSHCPTDGYDSGTGEFCMRSAANVTIPALSAAACGGLGTALNSSFGLGVSGAQMQLFNGTVEDGNHSPIKP